MDDDYDPLAPVRVGEEPDEPDGALTGFSDGDRIVRVWLDEGRLTRVRVSPVWEHKLAGRRLEDSFAAALAAARVRVAPEPEAADPGPVDATGLPGFSSVSFLRFRRALAAIDRRWNQVAADQSSAAPLQTATGEVEGVSVACTPDGLPARVSFDEEWLELASPGEIADGVVSAARRAQQAHQTKPDSNDELARLTRQREALLAGFSAMLTGGRA